MPPRSRRAQNAIKSRNPLAGAKIERTGRVQNDIALEVYDEMLTEAVASPTSLGENGRALKKRRTGKSGTSGNFPTTVESSSYEECGSQYGRGRQQTIHDDSQSSEASDVDWEQVDLKEELGSEVDAKQLSANDTAIKDISVVLDGAKSTQPNLKSSRRLPASALEKQKRLEIHKMHLCCLISHVYIRNSWCNNEKIQKTLRPLLSPRTLSYLEPDPSNPQFARSRSFADGLKQASDMWRAKFRITTRGLRKPCWTVGQDSVIPPGLPEDFDSSMRKVDFVKLSERHEGSRDAGAQMFCALLRSAGVEARLVCSLQALPFATVPHTPTAGKIKQTVVYAGTDSDDQIETGDEGILSSASRPASVNGDATVLATPNRVKRFYHRATGAASSVDLGKSPAMPAVKRKRIKESSYPVYWVEAFNVAIQKWLPVDPLVTMTVAKALKFEPPTSDFSNNLTYVVAFNEDGSAKDVTRRYAKAYNAKTRRSRVEITPGGERWWKKVMKIFDRGCEVDEDQVEEAELAHKEASEPMPRNVQDFKDHPYYALERHLRRNEVIYPRREVGKLGTGKASDAVEPIYRRRDVQLVKTADKWYRIGREIKSGEVPLQHAAKVRRKARSPSTGPASGGDDDDQGKALYAEFQTSLYIPPPIVQGRVPRNAFGNLDIYVPSMIPPGGVHIRAPNASRAARIVGIDFADAVTGFEFRGRHGTAVTKGIIVAKEYREAVEEVVKGLNYQRELAEEEKGTLEALRMWKRFLTGLKIRERVMGYEEGTDNVEGLNKRIDEIEEQEAEETGEGGFLPDTNVHGHNGIGAEHADPTMRDPSISEGGINSFSEQEFERHLSSYLETTIPSPWDPPGALSKFHSQSIQSRNNNTQPVPLSHARDFHNYDTGGGFLREEADVDSLPPDTAEETVGLAREDQEDPTPTTAVVYPQEIAEFADPIITEGEDIGAGGFLPHDAPDTTAEVSAAEDLDIQVASTNTARPRLDGTPTPPPVGKSAREPLQTEAEAAGAGTVAQTMSETDGEEGEGGDEGSMLSHDPEDEEAEPEWLVDEAAV